MRTIGKGQRDGVFKAMVGEDFDATLPPTVSAKLSRMANNRDGVWLLDVLGWSEACTKMAQAHSFDRHGKLHCAWSGHVREQCVGMFSRAFGHLKGRSSSLRNDLGLPAKGSRLLHDIVDEVRDGAVDSAKWFDKVECPLCTRRESAEWLDSIGVYIDKLIDRARELGYTHLVEPLRSGLTLRPRVPVWQKAAAVMTAAVNRTGRLDLFKILLEQEMGLAKVEGTDRVVRALASLSPEVLPPAYVEASSRIAKNLTVEGLRMWMESGVTANVAGSEVHSAAALSVSFYVGTRAIESWLAGENLPVLLGTEALTALVRIVVGTMLSVAQGHLEYRKVTGQ
jgi:hypothetical protein